MDCDGPVDVVVVVIVVVAKANWVAPIDTPSIELVAQVLFFLAQVHSTHFFILLFIPHMRTSIISMTSLVG